MSPLRIAVVGATHPYKGGVAAHTTTLATRLAAAGHDTLLVGWRALYPPLLYPGGEQAVPDGVPEVPPYPRTVRTLHWGLPGTWRRAGRRLGAGGAGRAGGAGGAFDAVVLAFVTPVQVPSLLALADAAGAGSGRPGTPRLVVVAHNVVPHEPLPGGAALVRTLLRRADAVVVHAPALAEEALAHGARSVLVADLPPHLPGGLPASVPASTPDPDGLVRVLALGIVRPYKGVDVLLEAAAAVPAVRVTVAGEQWGEAGDAVRRLAADPRLAGRVDVRDGYVPAGDLPALLGAHDVLALTYRDATASQNVLLAHAYGLPVLASAVGTFPEQVRDGVDGLIVPPSDVDATAAALRRLTEPGTLDGLRSAVPPVDEDGAWDGYLKVLLEACRG